MEISGKTALVTGADGFIGSHLVEMLKEEGMQIRALSQYNSFNNWGWLEDINCLDDIEVVCGDIRDPQFARSITEGIDFIFHLAALIAIPYSYSAPHSYVATNVIGTLNMLQAALDNNIKWFMHTSTSEVYGTACHVPIDEMHPLQPQSPYSATKIGADALVYSYYSSFELPITIARPFNTYGPRQSARAIIPSIIIQLLDGKKELHLGKTSPTRDFSYVEDTCRGLVELLKCTQKNGEIVNIGSNYEISVSEVINIIQKILGTKAEVKSDEQRIRPRNSEVERLLCDNTKIKSLTDFKPQISLQEGLERTIEWLQRPENLRKYKTKIYNV